MVIVEEQMIDKNVFSGSVYKASVDSIVFTRDNQAGEKKATIYGKKEGTVNLQNNMGDIETALDRIIAIQNELLGVSK